MENKEKKFKEWIKEHKKALVGAGVSITAISALVILGIKNPQVLERIWGNLKSIVEKKPVGEIKTESIEPIKEFLTKIEPKDIIKTTKKPHDVREHVRTLAKGYKPSEEKIKEAIEKGIELLSNQTIVDGYSTGVKAA